MRFFHIQSRHILLVAAAPADALQAAAEDHLEERPEEVEPDAGLDRALGAHLAG
jgi:hypothetical protein